MKISNIYYFVEIVRESLIEPHDTLRVDILAFPV